MLCVLDEKKLSNSSFQIQTIQPNLFQEKRPEIAKFDMRAYIWTVGNFR
jgi:hypothetical protein